MNIIYKTTNLINGKIYVGKHSQNICPVIFDGYLGSGVVIKSTIRKYGRENFERITLECVSEDLINECEIYWINELNSTDVKIGYNLSLGGSGGDTFTNNKNKDDTRKKISEKLKTYTNLPETKERVSREAKERWADPEFRKKISEKMTYVWNNNDFRTKQSILITKSKSGVEHREKVSKSMKNLFQDPEVKVKNAKHLISLSKDPEINKSRSKKIKEIQNHPENKLRVSEFMKGENHPNAIFIYVFKSPLGEIFETKCLSEFCRQHNLNQSKMGLVSNKKRNHHKGWTLISKNENIYK